MDFGKALSVIRSGGKVRRAHWAAGVMLSFAAFPPLEDGDLYIVHRDESVSRWLPVRGDLLAEDWGMVIMNHHPAETPLCPSCIRPADGRVLIWTHAQV